MAGKVSGFGDDDMGALSDINVTPLVDVVLVLLIVFMITVPAVVGSAPIKVDLPDSEKIAAAIEMADQMPLDIFLKRDDSGATQIYFGDVAVTLEELKAKIQGLGNITPETSAKISADQMLPYREVVGVMDTLSGLGIHKLALETKHVGK